MVFPSAEYPAEAWRAGQEGRVRYELDVDEAGEATACRVIESSGSEILDRTTCSRLMERGEFEPNVDEAGKAIAGTFTATQNWRKREPQFAGSVAIEVVFRVNEDGLTTDCEIIEASGALPDNFDRDRACPNARGIPYRNENGEPVARNLRLRMEVDVAPAE